jgi:hypothetical protein
MFLGQELNPAWQDLPKSLWSRFFARNYRAKPGHVRVYSELFIKVLGSSVQKSMLRSISKFSYLEQCVERVQTLGI